MKSFIQRHSHQLALLGALIVLTTFVTKEDLRESWKSQSESLETALYMYQIRSAVNDTWRAAQQSRRPDEIFEKRTFISQETEKNIAEVTIRAAAGRQRLDSLNTLLDRLQNDDKLQHKASLVRIHWQESSSRSTEEVMRMFYSVQTEGIPANLRMLSSTGFALRLIETAESEVADLEKQTQERASVLQEQAKGRSRLASEISDGLFVFGWLLGLVSKFAGSPIELTD